MAFALEAVKFVLQVKLDEEDYRHCLVILILFLEQHQEYDPDYCQEQSWEEK